VAVTTISDLNNLFNSIYEDAIHVAREMNLMTNLVDVKTAEGWMSRQIVRRPPLVAETVNDGQDYNNPQTFGRIPDASLTPGEVIVQVVLTDRVIETDPDGAKEDAAFEMGNAIATKIDTDLVSTFSGFSVDKGPGAANDADMTSFAAAITKLRANKTPAPIYVVLHPYQWHKIWLELGKPAANNAFLGDVANQAMREFFVSGPLMGATWFVNANIAVNAGAAVAGVFHPKAIMLDSRRPPRLEPERNASLRAWELNMSAGYAFGVVRNEFGVKYTSKCTEP
jgi:hypothetical protein